MTCQNWRWSQDYEHQPRPHLISRATSLLGASPLRTRSLRPLWKFGRHFSKGQPHRPNSTKQSSWDKASIQKSKQIRQEGVKTQVDRARLLAASEPGNGDCLKAYPFISCGRRIDNEVLRIAVELQLGLPHCEEHSCPCGETVDRSGLHALSCHKGKWLDTRW